MVPPWPPPAFHMVANPMGPSVEVLQQPNLSPPPPSTVSTTTRCVLEEIGLQPFFLLLRNLSSSSTGYVIKLQFDSGSVSGFYAHRCPPRSLRLSSAACVVRTMISAPCLPFSVPRYLLVSDTGESHAGDRLTVTTFHIHTDAHTHTDIRANPDDLFTLSPHRDCCYPRLFIYAR